MGDIFLRFFVQFTLSSPLYIEPSRRTRKGGLTMTDKETDEIDILQKLGFGYVKISKISKVPINTVKSYITRHPKERESICLQCGKHICQTDHRRQKKFCSPLCKSKWWYAHPHMMVRQNLNDFVCPVCSREFKDYGKRKYCSVNCYAKARRKT